MSKKTAEEFVNFLKEKQAYRAFERAMNRHRTVVHLKPLSVIGYCLERKSPVDYITAAFSWVNTGDSEFWHELSEDWQEICWTS